ncbi:MAG: phosphoenolpyruvate-utilizing protein, partial [Actinobacteria bacterium]|nr:phosphoenolpyruvate-utilizing protein [Actinomycetota bacterium]
DGSAQSGSDLPGARRGETLRAVPACPGRATGTVRIVSNPADPTNLRPGDVLVTPLAGPAWVPLFLSAGAVVVEVGSSLSHAAVDSREFGVPTVVGCTGATMRLVEGMPVTVDGAAGTVTIG